MNSDFTSLPEYSGLVHLPAQLINRRQAVFFCVNDPAIGMIKVDHAPDTVCHMIVKSRLAAFDYPLARPTEIIGDTKQRLRALILNIENDVTPNVDSIATVFQSIFGFLMGRGQNRILCGLTSLGYV